jgi:cytoskeletal protein RodZ
VLIGGVLAAVVIVGLFAAAVMRRRAQDDVHSVEHYHQRLHTLEEISTHPTVGAAGGEGNGHDDAAFPASAFRVSGSSTVRLTDPGHTIVPPVPPPPVPNPSEPVLFEDPSSDAPTADAPKADGPKADGPKADGPKAPVMPGLDERAMHSINHRPRRLGGPAAAVAAVLVLIVVLIVTGLHSNTPPKHPKSPGTATTVTTAPARSHPRSGTGATSHQKKKKTTTTAAPAAVSGPNLISANGATYQVANASYSLALTAKSGECWISATDGSSGAVLFTGVLTSGQSHMVTATGPVTVVAGAPAAFAATVNGVPVQLPFGFQAPFTLKFETPGTGSTGTGASSTTTTTSTAPSTSNSGGTG